MTDVDSSGAEDGALSNALANDGEVPCKPISKQRSPSANSTLMGAAPPSELRERLARSRIIVRAGVGGEDVSPEPAALRATVEHAPVSANSVSYPEWKTPPESVDPTASERTLAPAAASSVMPTPVESSARSR